MFSEYSDYAIRMSEIRHGCYDNEEWDECAYCGAMVHPVTFPMNSVEWADAAQEHAEGCEWVETKAHTESLETIN